MAMERKYDGGKLIQRAYMGNDADSRYRVLPDSY